MSANGRLAALQREGVSIWVDALGRAELADGQFACRVRDMSITGVTSNPSTFAAALRATDLYEAQILALVRRGERSARELFWSLALQDVQMAADILRPVYEATTGADGFVSFQCTLTSPTTPSAPCDRQPSCTVASIEAT